MEEKITQILFQAINIPEQSSEIFLRYFGPQNGIDLELMTSTFAHEPIDDKET